MDGSFDFGEPASDNNQFNFQSQPTDFNNFSSSFSSDNFSGVFETPTQPPPSNFSLDPNDFLSAPSMPNSDISYIPNNFGAVSEPPANFSLSPAEYTNSFSIPPSDSSNQSNPEIYPPPIQIPLDNPNLLPVTTPPVSEPENNFLSLNEEPKSSYSSFSSESSGSKIIFEKNQILRFVVNFILFKEQLQQNYNSINRQLINVQRLRV